MVAAASGQDDQEKDAGGGQMPGRLEGSAEEKPVPPQREAPSSRLLVIARA